MWVRFPLGVPIITQANLISASFKIPKGLPLFYSEKGDCRQSFSFKIVMILIALAFVVMFTACAKQNDNSDDASTSSAPAITEEKRQNGISVPVTPTESFNGILENGSCGQNATYTLTADGVLTISGTGPMNNADSIC